MDRYIALAAQLLPLVPPAAAVVLWLLLPLAGKLDLALRAVVAVAATAVLVLIAGLVHQDPRPFVVDPAHPALFPHPADNGFPSDHTAYAAAVALLIVTIRRRLGVVLLVIAVVGGLARVAAHVHHLQDIGAGLLIAVLAVSATTALFTMVHRMRRTSAQARTETAPASASRR